MNCSSRGNNGHADERNGNKEISDMIFDLNFAFQMVKKNLVETKFAYQRAVPSDQPASA